MNVEIGAEAALFPEKEYISGISVAVRQVFSTAKLYIWRQSMADGYHITCVVFLHNHCQAPIPFLSKLKRQLKELPIFRSL
jgi:hypothetical protein